MKTIEEAAEYYAHNNFVMQETNNYKALLQGFITGAKWQAKIMYSEQEVLHLLDTLWDRLDLWYNEIEDNEFNLRKWFDECELKKK